MEHITHSHIHTENLLYGHSTVLRPLSAGSYPPHTHEICELLLLRSGKISYVVEGKVYPLKKNSLVITRPGAVHAIRIDADEPYERYNLLFNTGKLLPELSAAIPEQLDVLHLDSGDTIVSLFKKMDSYYQQLQGPQLDRVLTLVTEEIFFNISISAALAPEQSAVSSNPLIQQAISYIEENITTLTNLEELCNALFVTKSHLHHMFLRHMQITPKKYILSKRLSLVQQALRAGGKPTEVYLQYGFNNYATFYRDYKRFYGHCPSDELSLPEIREFLS